MCIYVYYAWQVNNDMHPIIIIIIVTLCNGHAAQMPVHSKCLLDLRESDRCNNVNDNYTRNNELDISACMGAC